MLSDSDIMQVRAAIDSYRQAAFPGDADLLTNEEIDAIADFARGVARDCEWQEGSFDVALHELTAADVVRNMARHYDGGMGAMVADALADAHAIPSGYSVARQHSGTCRVPRVRPLHDESIPLRPVRGRRWRPARTKGSRPQGRIRRPPLNVIAATAVATARRPCQRCCTSPLALATNTRQCALA
jgi:hypothetical protein